MGYRINEECLACGTCVESCPNDAIIEGETFNIDPEKCENCGICIDSCPTGAIIEE
ncbi:MAG: DUF362 domain-containing protein [Bacillota bacterium]